MSIFCAKLSESEHDVDRVVNRCDEERQQRKNLGQCHGYIPPFGQSLRGETFKSRPPGALFMETKPSGILPKYRGASPIQQSVLNGDKETGVTAMQMDVGLDTGDILKVVKTEIGVNETSGELFDRLSLMGGELILDTLSALEKGEITPIKQDESLATHTSKIDKSLCPIDFTKSAFEVHNKIRGLNPWPIATTEINGKKIKVHSSLLCEKSGKAAVKIRQRHSRRSCQRVDCHCQ